MRKQKEQFLKAVWERIKSTKCDALDAVIDTAEASNIELEAAAKIVKGDQELAALIQQQAVQMNMIKVKDAA
jgi:hypothetical protein